MWLFLSVFLSGVFFFCFFFQAPLTAQRPVPVRSVPVDVTLRGLQPGDGKNWEAIGSVTGWKELSARSQKMEEVETHREQRQFD